MYLLDTDTLTHLHLGNPRVLERMQVLQDRDVQTTIISKIELLRGRLDHALKAATGAELLRAQQWLFRGAVEQADFNFCLSSLFAVLRQHFSRKWVQT